MLDGRRASFACSIVELPQIPIEDSQNWQWSADLSHHVLITPETVHVRSGRDPIPRNFQRESVELKLEEFLKFLDNPRRAGLPDVVSFLVQEFSGIWGVSGASDGATALVPFLLALCALEEEDLRILGNPTWCRETAQTIGIDDAGLLETQLNSATIERASGLRERTPLGLRLVPSLVLRHAAGRLFQEAHALIEVTQLGFFGDHSIVKSPTYSAVGAYFTPVPLARLLADWALSRLSPIPSELTIADYACGSAVFLTEALRALERRGFTGTVRLIGRDKSPQAIVMAKVAVRTAQRDLQTIIKVIPDISQADALDSEWPEADICLMNPPFRSWEQLSQRERAWVQGLTKGTARRRPDLSVGFLQRGFQALRPRGVLATLVPAGLLASEGLSKWRNELADHSHISLVAVLGEHGLFEKALVNVGILALDKNAHEAPSLRHPLYVAWSSAQSGAASRVIRAIRRSILDPDEAELSRASREGWSLSKTNIEMLQRRSSWLPGAGALGTLLETIQASTLTKVDDLFEVKQGIRTGANPLFIQPAEVVERLPEAERSYFRKAVDAASFVNGELRTSKYIFLAPNNTWLKEQQLVDAVPEFFNGYIRTNRDLLKQRASLRSRSAHYWELAEPRTTWMFKRPPRLVSKRFGLYPSFALDCNFSFAIVQANAWRPTKALTNRFDDDEICEVLRAYWWLLNSRVMVAVFREFCPNVAGGQLDLEHKYVKDVPIPNLAMQLKENPNLQLLASSLRSRYLTRLPEIKERDQFAAAAFGTSVPEWNLSGLEVSE